MGIQKGEGQGRCRLTKHPIYLVCFTISCNFQTELMMDVKSMGIIPMDKGKMPLKYWGMLPSLSGPLGLGRVADTMVGGVPYKRGGHVGMSKIYVGISTISLGCPHYSFSPPSSTTSYSLKHTHNPLPLLLHHLRRCSRCRRHAVHRHRAFHRCCRLQYPAVTMWIERAVTYTTESAR